MKKVSRVTRLGFLAWLFTILALPVVAQPWPYAPPTSRMAQNNAMHLVLNQAKVFQNAARVSSYKNGYGLLLHQFQGVRSHYAGFKGTLTMEQSVYGGNRLAELDAGLDIIQEAFANYQTALGNGQAPHHAFNNLKQVLSHAVGVWTQEFKQQVCSQIRVGR